MAYNCAHDNCSLSLFHQKRNPIIRLIQHARGQKSKFEIIVHFWCIKVALKLDNCNLKRLLLMRGLLEGGFSCFTTL